MLLTAEIQIFGCCRFAGKNTSLLQATVSGKLLAGNDKLQRSLKIEDEDLGVRRRGLWNIK